MEVWKDIPGWENQYQVSDLGRVKSLKRVNYFSRLGLPFRRAIEEKLLKPQIAINGYYKVSLTNSSVRVQMHVHRLVLLAFLGPKPATLQVCHNDGVKSNNALSNLRYDTALANRLDREKHRVRV